MSFDPEFKWDISTILDAKSGKPYVGVSIWVRVPDADDPSFQLVATWNWSIAEARKRSWMLQQAAEASEIQAHLITALRESKIPESDIEPIVQRVRSQRGK